MTITQNVPLDSKNWFRTGGTAAYYCDPTTPEELQEALAFGNEKNLQTFFLGEGANILISDAGFDGLVIHSELNKIHILPNEDTTGPILVEAQAGVTVPTLIEFCLAHDIIGLEEFSGIPGTVGGAVYINIHYFNFLLSHFLVGAQVVENATGTLMNVDNEWFAFGYDQSTLQAQTHSLVSATFRLTRGTHIEGAYARGRRVEIIRHRHHRYPTSHTCGSFFRNFIPEEVTLMINDRKMHRVAYYLDVLGIKGKLRVGGAYVSSQHANMIVTSDEASSQDIITLAHQMQTKVFEAFQIVAQPECQLIGFDEYPLLTSPTPTPETERPHAASTTT